MTRVCLTRRWPKVVEDKLRVHFDVQINEKDRPLNSEQIRQALSSCDAVCPTVTDAMPAGVFAGEVRCRVLGNFGVGYNHIDCAAASSRGITVTNTPDVLTDCTADLTLALMLMVARRVEEGAQELRAGKWLGWRPTHLMGSRVSGKTLGIVGMGRIGTAVARRAHHGFNMPIRYFNRRAIDKKIEHELSALRMPALEPLFSECDFVSIHCPSTSQTQGLVNAARLSLMRPDSFLINTARGDIVDESALVQALGNGTLAGAGLDVFVDEPQVNSALLEAPNAVLLPHLGSASRETRIAMGLRVVDNLVAFFAGESPPDVVSAPSAER